MSNKAIIQFKLLQPKADNEQKLYQILPIQELSLLNDRSNSKGLALPKAHQQLSKHFTHIEPGYLKVNWDIVAK